MLKKDLAFSVSASDSYSLLASAYLEFAKQNIPAARTLVERIIIATPNNADVLMLQGKLAIIEKDYTLAISSFKKYLEAQPNSGKVNLFIADALVKNGQYDEAEKIADAILAKIPNQPFLQYIKALVRFENKDYSAASEYSNQSINSGFNSFSLQLVAGASAFYLKNYELSHHHLQELMPYLSRDHLARRMLAVSQLKLGLIDDISETLKDYDTSNKANVQFLSTLSYELLEIGAVEKAKAMANYATSSGEGTAEEIAKAGFLKLMMNDPSGIENLELALQQNPELASAELALAFASIEAGNLARATEISEQWLEKNPNKAVGYNLKATIFFEEGKYELANDALEKSLAIEPNNVQALIQLVKLTNYQNGIDTATLIVQQALEAHPNNIEVLNLYFKLHKNEDGLKIISQAQQNNAENIMYGLVLADALIQLKKYKQADTLLDGFQLNAKTPKRYWQLLISANVKRKDGKDILFMLEKWKKTSPYHIEPIFLLANYWAIKKEPDIALNLLNSALKKHPNNSMIHLLKMQILLYGNRTYDAKILYKELKKFDINEDLLAGIEGRIFLLERNFSAAVPKLQQQYTAKASDSNATYLAFALEGNGQKQEAIQLLERHRDKHETNNIVNPRISLNLANMYLAKHRDKAINEYERLLTSTPDNVVVLNNLSWLYMEKRKLDEALKYAKQAFDLSSNIPNVVDTYSQVLLKSGKKVQALIKAKEANELAKGKDNEIALNLAEVYIINKKLIEAKRVLNGLNDMTEPQQERKSKLLKSL